jgi:putative phage-type endonuclease
MSTQSERAFDDPVPVSDADRAALRRKGIGGSDAAAILGVSRWGSPLGVWASKLGLAPGGVESEEMKMGKLLEPVVANLYSERTGRRLRRPGFMRHAGPDDWMIGQIDRMVLHEPVLVEIKTSKRYDGWGPDGSDQIPEDYYCQVQHYIEVSGAERAECAVLLAGSNLRIYPIAKHPEFIQIMMDRERTFWTQHVLTGVPPSLDDTEACARIIARMFPQEGGDKKIADSHVVALAYELRQAMENRKVAEADLRRVENEIKYLMGEHRCLVGDDFEILWTNVKGQTTVDWDRAWEELRAKLPSSLHEEMDGIRAAWIKTGEPTRRFWSKWTDQTEE